MKNKISIIITNFNRSKYLDRAIRSCLDQSISITNDLEIIVVDDASTDSSLEILKMFKNSIKIIKHKRNLGVAAASNSGIKAAKGNFIIRLDADDFLSKYNIQILSEILLHNKEYDFAYSDHYRVDEAGFKIKKVRLNTNEMLFEHGAGVMIKKKVFKKIGFYNETLKNCEDYDLLFRIVSKFKGYYIPLPLYRYYIHGKNISLEKQREKFKKIVKKIHGI